MTLATPNSQRETPDTLAIACIGHLQQEEAMLTATRELLRGIRAALVSRDHDELAVVLESQQKQEQSAADLHAARMTMRQRISRSLVIPDSEATLNRLAACVSGETQMRLASGRRRLQKLAAEIEAINRCNAILVQQSMGLLHQVLFCLTGQDSSSQRYGATGRMASGEAGPVIHYEC